MSNQYVWIVEGYYPGRLGWCRMGEASTYVFARKMGKLLKDEHCFTWTRKKTK